MTRETAEERRAWELLTRDFYWDVPTNHPVKVYDESGEFSGAARLQVFEMAVTTVLAHMRPEFAWCVTQNRKDYGVDFIGVQRFLDDSELGITAAITVGGQCKKRTRVNDVLDEIAGSLIRMADAVNPTFFVVALSARLTRQRVEKARSMLERQCQRQCHILDRVQIEGLLGDHLDALTEILSVALSGAELDELLGYFKVRRADTPAPSVRVIPPTRVLAGAPIRIDVNVQWTLTSNPTARLWWGQRSGNGDGGVVTLIGPIGADTPAGIALASGSSKGDPLEATFVLELTTYTVGSVDLGEVVVGLGSGLVAPERIALGQVDVIETMRPRFFDRPYRAGLARLSSAYEMAAAGQIASVGVIGMGGSGKSRMCEEFALEKRRRGCGVATGKHAKTHEGPHRILADLLTNLTSDQSDGADPADNVIRSLGRYDQLLAARAAPAIRAIFGTRTPDLVETTEQSVVSALLLLIVARSRYAPLIVHLQDLHWCSADMLLLLERLVWQLHQIVPVPDNAEPLPGSGVLFLFEGRVGEKGGTDGDAWTSAPFEAFLRRTDSTTVMCSSFTPEDGLDFTRLLFEDRHNADRLVSDDLLILQRELIGRVHAAAGGNPFHTLEQVRLLKETGVLGQNRKTGLLYMIRPDPMMSALPDSVFAAVELRWQYLRNRTPELALLLWASALLEDQIPAPLFRHLWRELSPEVSLRDIDGTDMVWTGDGTSKAVTFRHENYFESLRRFTVSEADRRRVVNAYLDWFAALRRPSPADRFRWARAILEGPDPDLTHAKTLLATALNGSRKAGDMRLARRILAFYLDLTWTSDDRSSVSTPAFLRACDDEIELCRQLLGIDRNQAAKRLERVREHIGSRLGRIGAATSKSARGRLNCRRLTAEAVHAQLLFNDRRPSESAERAGQVVEEVRILKENSLSDSDWESLEMEALYTLSCGQAISGEFGLAVESSRAAANIAEGSTSPLARKIVSTYGTMLLSEDPEAGEVVLRGCLASWSDDGSSDAFLVHVHLSMALVLQAYLLLPGSVRRHAMLTEARERTTNVHDSCRRLGLYADAGAAALVRGIVSALGGEGDEASWFAQGVAAAARGRQMETLWRSHINLASALYRQAGRVEQSSHDHALAALDIMQDTLSVYSQPDRSPRFELLRVGMASATSMLFATGDETGTAVLERYPRLRTDFHDVEAGVLVGYRGGERHYQWLRVDNVDYVLY